MFQLLLALAGFTFVGLKIYREFARDVVSFRRPTRLRAQDHEISEYLKQIAFYNQLNATDKVVFLDRVQFFLMEKDYQGMQGQVITDEVRTIVAASAVQIAFRLSEWKFPSFRIFRIYPESFYSNIFRKYLKGGAGQTGQIWFSLRDYRDGYAHPTNGINLGLHEMAHAAVIEMQKGQMDDDFANAHDHIVKLSEDRIPKIRSGEIKFLREYAGANHMEFIAVCTEHFFERPDEFRELDRELYDAFMWLYKQEPHTPPSVLQITNLPKREKSPRNYRYSKWHWSLTLVLVGIFIAPIALLALVQSVALSAGSIWLLSMIILGGSGALLYKSIVKSGALDMTQFLLCHVFGLWPLILALFFLCNNYVSVWEQGEVHQVTRIYWITNSSAEVVYDSSGPRDEGYHIIHNTDKTQLYPGAYVIVVTQYGPFGVPVYGNHRVVRTEENAERNQ